MKNNSGASLIATVLTLLIFALFIAIAVSLVTTGSNISLQEEQGTQAFYIAEGGIEYAAMLSFPNFDTTTSINLGSGSFTVAVPVLSNNIDNAATSITVSSTEGFTAAPDGNFWVMMCDTALDSRPVVTPPSVCEKMRFISETANTFTGDTTANTRGRHTSSPAAHLANAVVLSYTWNTGITTTTATTTNASTSRICVNPYSGFKIPGYIQIADTSENSIEDVFCSGTGNTPAQCGASCTSVLCFTGCVRNAFNGNSNGPSHSPNTNLYQSRISAITTSTGIITTNIVAGNIQRTVRTSFEPK